MDRSIELKLKELDTQIEEKATLEKLADRFPDLKIHTNRWNTKRYTSAEANANCTDYDLAHNCGCCNDSPLEMWPYMEFEGTKIYAEGIPFRIGERDYDYSYEREYGGWQEKLRNAKIPEEIITKLTCYFTANERPRDENGDRIFEDD